MNDVELIWIPFNTPNFVQVFQQQATVMRPAGYTVAATFPAPDSAGTPGVMIVFQRPLSQ